MRSMSLWSVGVLVGLVCDRRAVLASVGVAEVVEFVLVRGFLVVAVVRDRVARVAELFVGGGSAKEDHLDLKAERPGQGSVGVAGSLMALMYGESVEGRGRRESMGRPGSW